MNFDLGRTRRLMARIGNPQDRFPAVHIAGTNGKGSVAAFVSSALRASGLKTGVYTSPHLERLNERFAVDGRDISDADLSRLTSRLKRAFRGAPRPTQFEFLTAIAFAWFAAKKVDVAVVEVGLGGRLDATNVLGNVAVSVITNIGFDHMAWLGNTLPKIAAEKAGILRPGVPVVTGADGAALATIRRIAARVGAPVVLPPRTSPGRTALQGTFQRRNAAVAAAAVCQLKLRGWPIGLDHLKRGLASARWPGRFERFTLKAGQNRISMILDGAHNAPAAAALAESLRGAGVRKVALLFGALSDKDLRALSRTLAPFAAEVVTVPVPSGRSATAARLAALPAWKGKARAASGVDAALDRWIRNPPAVPVLVAGSLYLVGAVKTELRKRKLT